MVKKVRIVAEFTPNEAFPIENMRELETNLELMFNDMEGEFIERKMNVICRKDLSDVVKCSARDSYNRHRDIISQIKRSLEVSVIEGDE